MVSGKTDHEVILKARLRVLALYEKLGTWRKVGKSRAIVYTYAYRFVKTGWVPDNKTNRRALFLPKYLPSERRPKPRPRIHIGDPGWEMIYLKKVK